MGKTTPTAEAEILGSILLARRRTPDFMEEKEAMEDAIRLVVHAACTSLLSAQGNISGETARTFSQSLNREIPSDAIAETRFYAGQTGNDDLHELLHIVRLQNLADEIAPFFGCDPVAPEFVETWREAERILDAENSAALNKAMMLVAETIRTAPKGHDPGALLSLQQLLAMHRDPQHRSDSLIFVEGLGTALEDASVDLFKDLSPLLDRILTRERASPAQEARHALHWSSCIAHTLESKIVSRAARHWPGPRQFPLVNDAVARVCYGVLEGLVIVALHKRFPELLQRTKTGAAPGKRIAPLVHAAASIESLQKTVPAPSQVSSQAEKIITRGKDRSVLPSALRVMAVLHQWTEIADEKVDPQEIRSFRIPRYPETPYKFFAILSSQQASRRRVLAQGIECIPGITQGMHMWTTKVKFPKDETASGGPPPRNEVTAYFHHAEGGGTLGPLSSIPVDQMLPEQSDTVSLGHAWACRIASDLAEFFDELVDAELARFIREKQFTPHRAILLWQSHSEGGKLRAQQLLIVPRTEAEHAGLLDESEEITPEHRENFRFLNLVLPENSVMLLWDEEDRDNGGEDPQLPRGPKSPGKARSVLRTKYAEQ